MAWLEIHIKTSDKHANELSDELNQLGALAVTFKDAGDQPIYEPSPDNPRLWHETIVIGLFDPDHPIDALIRYLEQQQAAGKLEHFHLKHLENQDWQRICLDSFKPLQFGNRLWICPSWHQTPDPNAINVTLDPGLAFGTGTHPTTALCLEWLDKNITGTEELVIDYGCGSGILAIAALKLGAKHVLAVDNDPQALEATRSNAERNHISTPKLITCSPQKVENQQADILIANILAQPLIDLAPILSSLVKPHGKIVLSGILSEQSLDITNTYNKWFAMSPPISRAEWVRLDGEKQDNLTE